MKEEKKTNKIFPHWCCDRARARVGTREHENGYYVLKCVELMRANM